MANFSQTANGSHNNQQMENTINDSKALLKQIKNRAKVHRNQYESLLGKRKYYSKAVLRATQTKRRKLNNEIGDDHEHSKSRLLDTEHANYQTKPRRHDIDSRHVNRGRGRRGRGRGRGSYNSGLCRNNQTMNAPFDPQYEAPQARAIMDVEDDSNEIQFGKLQAAQEAAPPKVTYNMIGMRQSKLGGKLSTSKSRGLETIDCDTIGDQQPLSSNASSDTIDCDTIGDQQPSEEASIENASEEAQMMEEQADLEMERTQRSSSVCEPISNIIMNTEQLQFSQCCVM
eukprot:229360_1